MKNYFTSRKVDNKFKSKDFHRTKDIVLGFIYYHNYIEKQELHYQRIGNNIFHHLIPVGDKLKDHLSPVEKEARNSLNGSSAPKSLKLWRKICTRYEYQLFLKEVDMDEKKYHILNDYRPYCPIINNERAISNELKDRLELTFGRMDKIPVSYVNRAIEELKYNGFLIERLETCTGKVTGYDLTENAKSYFNNNKSFYDEYQKSSFTKVGSNISMWSLLIAIASSAISLLIIFTANWDKIRVNTGLKEPTPQEIKIISDNKN